MDLEIQRVARELYKAFSGMNEEFKEVIYDLLAGELRDLLAEGPDSDWWAELAYRQWQAGTNPSLQGSQHIINTHRVIPYSDNIREKLEQRADGQPGGQLGGGLRHPHVWDEDVWTWMP